eukprot:14898776-Alexandrium_andersonii.AAC.1
MKARARSLRAAMKELVGACTNHCINGRLTATCDWLRGPMCELVQNDYASTGTTRMHEFKGWPWPTMDMQQNS